MVLKNSLRCSENLFLIRLPLNKTIENNEPSKKSVETIPNLIHEELFSNVIITVFYTIFKRWSVLCLWNTTFVWIIKWYIKLSEIFFSYRTSVTWNTTIKYDKHWRFIVKHHSLCPWVKWRVRVFKQLAKLQIF